VEHYLIHIKRKS